MDDATDQDLRARERWLIKQIEQIKREMMERAEPFVRELGELRDARGPDPFVDDNGRSFLYTGPLPRYTPHGPERGTARCLAPSEP